MAINVPPPVIKDLGNIWEGSLDTAIVARKFLIWMNMNLAKRHLGLGLVLYLNLRQESIHFAMSLSIDSA